MIEAALLRHDPDARRGGAILIDALVRRIQTAINHLNEFRTALLSAAVTGKIDVREAATR